MNNDIDIYISINFFLKFDTVFINIYTRKKCEVNGTENILSLRDFFCLSHKDFQIRRLNAIQRDGHIVNFCNSEYLNNFYKQGHFKLSFLIRRDVLIYDKL